MPEPQEEKSKDLRRCVFDRIDQEKLEPKAKCWFTMRQISIWLLWVATVTLGAVTTAVLLFVARYQQYAVYEITHRDGLSFIVSVLPLVWIVLFLTAVIVAYFELRNTPRGYKYPFWKILGGSVLAIVVLGVVFEIISLGSLVDRKLGSMSDMYRSQTAREAAMWQQPEVGRVVGVVATGTTFVDTDGTAWEILESELQPNEARLLHSGREVKMYGTTTDEGLFVACGVLPVMKEASTRAEFKEARQQFANKMREYKALAKAELVAEHGTNTKPCRMLPVFNLP